MVNAMRNFLDRGDTSSRLNDRLETPATAGYRRGMSSPCVIGRKLDRMYRVSSETPREIGDLLQEIDRKACRN